MKEIIYKDYLLIKQMSSPMNRKCRMMTDLLGQWDDFWKVIGITKEALNVFAKNDFKCPSRIGINRSHVHQDRNVTNTFLLTNDLTYDEFWEYIIKNDVTALATSSENLSNKWSEVLSIDRNLNLFTSSGYKWKHNKKEQDFLKKLYQENILK